jgi:hypothetical protein
LSELVGWKEEHFFDFDITSAPATPACSGFYIVTVGFFFSVFSFFVLSGQHDQLTRIDIRTLKKNLKFLLVRNDYDKTFFDRGR